MEGGRVARWKEEEAGGCWGVTKGVWDPPMPNLADTPSLEDLTSLSVLSAEGGSTDDVNIIAAPMLSIST